MGVLGCLNRPLYQFSYSFVFSRLHICASVPGRHNNIQFYILTSTNHKYRQLLGRRNTNSTPAQCLDHYLQLNMTSPKILTIIITTILFGCNSPQLKTEKDRKSTMVDTTKFYPANSKDSLQKIYFETAKSLWQTYVPKSGQAKTEQGELIRIIEKLDNEIRGNAKGNWDDQFVLLANSLRDSLISSKIFPPDVENEIRNDVDSLTRSEEELFMDNDIYDRLTRRVVEWYWRHKEPIKHIENTRLKR